MRHINEAGLALVKKFEGFSSEPYQDQAGHFTIGWGHLIMEGENFTEITPEEAENILQMDLNRAESAVDRLIKVTLTDNQFAALVSFTFNLGSGALYRSTLRKVLNGGEYIKAAKEFPRWIFSAGVRNKGLLRRRIAERNLFLT